MTLPLDDRHVQLAPPAGTTVLSWNFRLTRADGLAVFRTRAGAIAALQAGLDYSFPGGLGGDGGGSLTLTAASEAGDVYDLAGMHPEQRLSDFVAQLGFSAAKFNADLDALTMMAQEHRRDIGRAWKSRLGTAGQAMPAPEAGRIIGWSEAGAIENKTVLQLGSVETRNDPTLGGTTPSPAAVPVEAAVKQYVDGRSNLLNVAIAGRDFGVAADGTTSDSAAIQAVIDAMGARGGGEIVLPPASSAIDVGLLIQDSHVVISGQGGGQFGNGIATTRANAATRLVYTGDVDTGSLVEFSSNPADDGSRAARNGGGLKNVMLDGNQRALSCLALTSWHNGTFEGVHAAYAREYGYKLWTLAGGVPLGSGNTLHNLFTQCLYTELNTSSNPKGMIFASRDANFNCCYNRFVDLMIVMDGTGDALSMENTDNNLFLGGKAVHRLGNTTARTVLHASDTGTISANAYCRHNAFFWFEGRFVAKAAVATGNNSNHNMIFGQTLGNAMPQPSIEPGAGLQFWSTDRLQALSQWLWSFDSGAAAGPDLNFMRDSASPAASDAIGRQRWFGRDTDGNQQLYASITGQLLDPTAGTEDGGLAFGATVNGASVTSGFMRAAWMVGAPAGSDTGVGTINIQTAIYMNAIMVADAAGGLRHRSYTAAQIGDITNAVNTANKAAGKSVFDSTNGRILVASGSSAGSAWNLADGTAAITPS